MKALSGKIVGNKQTNTLVVEVERFFRHRVYEKRIRRTKRYHIHFEGEGKKLGDIVFNSNKKLKKLNSITHPIIIKNLERNICYCKLIFTKSKPFFNYFFIRIHTKSPPQVVTEATHTSFPVWRIRQPCNGFFMPYTTYSPCLYF